MTEATEWVWDMEANSSEIPAGTESVLVKVFLLIMCLHSTCHTEDTPPYICYLTLCEVQLKKIAAETGQETQNNICRIFRNGFFTV